MLLLCHSAVAEGLVQQAPEHLVLEALLIRGTSGSQAEVLTCLHFIPRS